MMKMIRPLMIMILGISLTFPVFARAEGRWLLDIEGGLVMPGYNNVQIPNDDQGTRFSLKKDLDIQEKAYVRLRLSYRISKKHALSLLYAPLTLHANGTLDQAVYFQGTRFQPGTAVNALYRFNSYRLTYKYLLVDKPKLHLWLGFTAKIRDAEIKLEAPESLQLVSQESTKTNVGFVPLIHAYLEWRPLNRAGIILEIDALAAKQGRAEDVAAAFFYKANDWMKLKAGYRFVEGGADSAEVYTFALINYFFAGVLLNF